MQYVVKFSNGDYLVLHGVFEYERSTANLQTATLMPRSKATAYAALWEGAEVIQVG